PEHAYSCNTHARSAEDPGAGGPHRRSRSGDTSSTASLGLLKVPLKPDLLVQVVLDCGGVLVGRCRMPASAEPSAHAAPRVARAVLAAPLHVVEPALPSPEPDAPDDVRGLPLHPRGPT